MPTINTYMEMAPWAIPVTLAQVGEPTHPRVFREGWFRWFYLAQVPFCEPLRVSKILIGPFRSRGRALDAWDLVCQIHDDWHMQQQMLAEAMGLQNEYEAYQKGEQSALQDPYPHLPPNN